LVIAIFGVHADLEFTAEYHPCRPVSAFLLRCNSSDAIHPARAGSPFPL
jgi:hypothetical protein